MTLTVEQIDTLSLDDLRLEVAKALGWHDFTNESHTDEKGATTVTLFGTDPSGDGWMVPNYPRDMGAAWGLIAQWCDCLERRFLVDGSEGHSAYCSLSDMRSSQPYGEGHGLAVAEAICRAFLKAVTSAAAR